MAYIYLRKNSIWRFAGILFLALIITFVLVQNVVARYETKSSGGASARVAAYAFSMMGEGDLLHAAHMNVAGDGASIYQIQVYNFKESRVCEVRQSYTITVDNLTDNLNLTVTFHKQPDCSDTPVAGTGVLAPGVMQTDIWYVKIAHTGSPSADVTDEIDLLQISVNAQQIQ